MKLKFVLLLLFCTLALTPPILFRLWPFTDTLESEHRDVSERQLLLARSFASSMQLYKRQVALFFDVLADGDRGRFHLARNSDLLANLHFRYFCIADLESGRVDYSLGIAVATCPPAITPATLSRFEGITAAGTITFDSVAIGDDGVNEVRIVKPLVDGRIAIGAIGTGFFRELGENMSLGQEGYLTIVDQTGLTLYHPETSWMTERRSLRDLEPVRRLLQGEEGVANYVSSASGEEFVAGFASAEGIGWGVLLSHGVSHIVSHAHEMRQSANLILLLGGIGSLFLAIVVSLAITRPLERVTRASRRIAAGDLVMPPEPGWQRILPFEIRQLHRSFCEMVVRLRDSTARVNTLAFVDSVTGLANREYFRQNIDAFVGATGFDGGAALLFLDLDGFKSVNDTKGHDAGDIMLRHVADRLCETVGVPPFDPNTSSPQDCRNPVIARLGGDEFVIFLPNFTGDDASALADKVLGALSVPFDIGESPVALSCSIGVARFPEHGAEYSSLLKAADLAMYDAKRSGKNQIKLYFSNLHRRSSGRHFLADDLFSGAFAEQMDMIFQPIYRTGDMDYTGVEGLIRWQHPTEGLLEPNQFLPAVAALGMQRQIDTFAFEHATALVSDLAARGIDTGSLSLNLPMERLIDKPFMDLVIRNLPLPFAFSVELVESSFLDIMDSRIYWSIDRLKEAGVGIELDDFGSTHASVSSLLDLGPKRIKLDTGLVRRISEDVRIAAILRSLVDMAHGQGVEVVGKGAEFPSQVEVLTELGCDYLQGYALSTPMTASQLASVLHPPDAAEA